MLSTLGIDASPAVQYVIAFAVIFGLLALLALGLRRLTASRVSVAAQDRGRARQPRLGIVDVYDLDRQRQLILLRRDNVEHLLLIGGPNDLVVETNIARVSARSVAPGENGLDRADYGAEAPTRPVVEPPRPNLDAPLPARLGPLAVAREEASDAEAELAPIATTSPQPARAHMEPVLKPDVVAPAPLRPSGAVPAASARATEPRRAATALGAIAGGGTPAPDPSVLSDMAKQLEQALRRPAAPAQPQPTSAPAMPHPDAAPGQPPPPPPRRPDAVRPAAPTRPVPTPRPAEAAVPSDVAEQPAAATNVPASQTPAPAVANPELPAGQGAPQAAPGPTPMPQAAPAPSPAPGSTPVPPPAPPAPSPASPARAGAADPFSVEEIEAEFARLLGRPLDKAEHR